MLCAGNVALTEAPHHQRKVRGGMLSDCGDDSTGGEGSQGRAVEGGVIAQVASARVIKGYVPKLGAHFLEF